MLMANGIPVLRHLIDPDAAAPPRACSFNDFPDLDRLPRLSSRSGAWLPSTPIRDRNTVCQMNGNGMNIEVCGSVQLYLWLFAELTVDRGSFIHLFGQ